MHDDPLPKLAAPGAGIPFVARLFNRFILKPFTIRKVPWDTCTQQFESAHAKVVRELETFPAAELTRKVLVPPQIGLEDSSRYWSAAMTARHLTIVGTAIERTILELSHGRPGPVPADTSKVKPEDARNDAAALPEYLRFAADLTERLRRGMGDPRSPATHRHPWFGPLNAKDWYWLLGAHTQIHLRQLRRIRSGLPTPPLDK